MDKFQIREKKERICAGIREGCFLSREQLMIRIDWNLRNASYSEGAGDYGDASDCYEMAAGCSLAIGESREAARLYTQAADFAQILVDCIDDAYPGRDCGASGKQRIKRLREYAAAARHEAALEKVGARRGVRGVLHKLGWAA